jgi:4-amino-4-deoxy-L-arabinose transferase-like glycosyltransferase
MKYMEKIINNRTVVILTILILLYLCTRLFNLLILPLFTDESIYIYWAKIIQTTHSQWFISLTDGKPPLLIWMITILLSIFPSDWYLSAGRLPSVFMGLLTLIAMYKTGELLFNSRRAGGIAAVLYILCPMTLFYDRMALFDSMVTSMLLISVYFAVRTGRSRKLIDALLWGVFLGLAFLSKPTALLFMPLTVIAAFLPLPTEVLKKEGKTLSMYTVVALALGYGINSLQRISSAYPAMVRKNSQFQQPIAELLVHPFLLTFGNMQGFISWMTAYLTAPFLIFSIGAFLFGFTKKARETALLFILWLAPLLLLATVGREIFPRYILIVIPYVLLMTAYLIDQMLMIRKRFRYLIYILLFIIVLPLLRFDYFILTDPAKAPLPESDANQYVLEHPSGYGLKKVYAFIRARSADQKITVVTQGTFGLYPYAFYLEFWGDPNVAILPKWPLDKLDAEIITASKTGPVYVILKEHESVPKELPLTQVLKADKPGGKFPILVTTFKHYE